jgi:hypothetical protein
MATTLIRKSQLVNLAIANADVAANAAIATTKLADGANFIKRDGSVAMTGALAMGNQKITGLATPTAATDAATKGYVDGLAAGLDVKASVRAASTANIAFSVPGYEATQGASGRGRISGAPNTLDGVNLAAGNRILIKNQSTGAANGIYVVTTLGTGNDGVWDRATDFDEDAEVTAGAFVFVEDGTVNADSGWVLSTNNPITIGGASGTALEFAQFSGAGQITAGDGLTKTGNTLNVVTASSARIVVNQDNIDLAAVTRTDSSGTAGISFIQSFTSDNYGRVTAAVTADIRAASTSQTGIVQLNNNTNSTSTSQAATANAVKTAWDLANAALPKAGGTMGGKITLVTSAAAAASIRIPNGADPNTPEAGDIWNKSNALSYYNGSAVKTIAFTDSNITGTAANVSGIVAVANGGTGANNATSARTNLGATTVGANLFTLTNPSAITFLRVNADNTVSALSGADFRTALDVPKTSNFKFKQPITLVSGNIYTVPDYIFPGSEHVYLNGVLLNEGASDDYTVGAGVNQNRITFNYALDGTDYVQVTYWADPSSGAANQGPSA